MEIRLLFHLLSDTTEKMHSQKMGVAPKVNNSKGMKLYVCCKKLKRMENGDEKYGLFEIP